MLRKYTTLLHFRCRNYSDYRFCIVHDESSWARGTNPRLPMLEDATGDARYCAENAHVCF